MSLMDEPKLMQELNIPANMITATTSASESPSKLNAEASAFVPSGETKTEKEWKTRLILQI